MRERRKIASDPVTNLDDDDSLRRVLDRIGADAADFFERLDKTRAHDAADFFEVMKQHDDEASEFLRKLADDDRRVIEAEAADDDRRGPSRKAGDE
jgi:hypothetical protein